MGAADDTSLRSGSSSAHHHAPSAEAKSTGPRKRRIDGTVVAAFVAVLLLVVQRFLMPYVNTPALQSWSAVFIAICIQAMPFLVGGTLVSAFIAVFMPAKLLRRVVPKNPVLAVPVACASGALLPGCECASVPVSHALMRRGVTPAAALTFLLAAPAINPVVLVATAVAFPDNPAMVWARLLASVAVSVAIGWLWLALRRPELLRLPDVNTDDEANSWGRFRAAAVHDLLHAGGYLVVGAVLAATINVFLPNSVMSFVSERPWLAVLALAALAFLIAMCSEADAFVAASFRELGPAAQLTFMVVGPAVDIKLVSMQVGTFGRRFAAVFAPATFIVAILCSVAVASFML